MGYGTSAYGLGSYGGGGGTLSVDRAWAISTHGVHVELTAAARAIDAFDIGDALNPVTWSVVKRDSGEILTVISSEMADDATATKFNLTVLEPLGDATVVHTVGSDELLAADLSAIVAPYTAEFRGVTEGSIVEPNQVRRQRWRDLANPVRIDGANGHLVGSIVIGSDGDYDTEEGEAVARKMVIRRVTTPRGAFRHLPNFGVGFLIKEPLPQGGDLAKLSKEVEDQVLQEPDITAVRAEVSILYTNVVLVRVRAKMGNGVTFNVGVRRGGDGTFVEF